MTGQPDGAGEPRHYTISVAAALAGMHAQTLRQYDRIGLVTPKRTKGRGRRYTPQDVARLRRVQKMSQEGGVNLAGVQLALKLEDTIAQLESEVEMLKGMLQSQSTPIKGVFTADSQGRVQLRPLGSKSRSGRHREKRDWEGDRASTDLVLNLPVNWLRLWLETHRPRDEDGKETAR